MSSVIPSLQISKGPRGLEGFVQEQEKRGHGLPTKDSVELRYKRKKEDEDCKSAENRTQRSGDILRKDIIAGVSISTSCH